MTETPGKAKLGKSDGGRGMSYPFITIEQAVVRAKQLWENEGKNLAYVSAAVKHWGFGGGMSGTARQTIAALKAYGLIQDEGAGGGRQIRLTERALDILVDADPARRRKAIQEAATLPKVYSELLSKWSSRNLPSDRTIEAHLLRELNFNRNTVMGFIKNFRSNVAFSGLDGPSYTPPKSLPTNGSSGVPNELNPAEMTPPAFIPPTKLPLSGNRQDTFSLDEGIAILQWPANLSEASYEDFESWIQLQLKKIKRTVAH